MGTTLPEGALHAARALLFMELAAYIDQAQKQLCAEGFPVVHTTGPGRVLKREMLQDAQGNGT